MKTYLALSTAFAVVTLSAHAQITINDPAYGVLPYYTHSNADRIVSFDFGADGALYYQTDASFTFGGFYQNRGGVTTTLAPASTSVFSGASVVSAGQTVYYNTSDSTRQLVYSYGPLAGTPAVSQALNQPNYGLAVNGDRLFLTAAPKGTNHIYYKNLSATDGSFLNADPAIDLGADAGFSGPLAFNTAGDLFYAPGGGDLSIYRWSASAVANAIANPLTDPLSVTGDNLWRDYSSAYSNVFGGTSMTFDGDGDLLLTLTNFSDPSILAKFGVGPDGKYDGSTETVLSEVGILGELRLVGGAVLLSDGNQILQIVPEPASWALIGFAAAAFAVRRIKRPS